MKKLFSLIVATLSFGFHFAQQAPDEKILKEVENQVWNPFQEAYNNYDAQAFNSLHTDDVLRISPWGIHQGDAYKQRNIQSFSRVNRPKRTIEFRFEHRVYSEAVGYEVGFYKILQWDSLGDVTTHYGRFHVVLKKIENHWKIAQDWDTSRINGVPLAEADYQGVKN